MIVSIVIGVVLLIFGMIIKFSDIQRNSLFGYRTYLSMKNEANWKFANRKFSKHAIVIGLISLATGLTSLLYPINDGYILFCIMTLLLISIITIEISLKKFDKESSDK